MQDGKQAVSVSALTRRIKGALEGTFRQVFVEGEVSNFTRPASGHLYFTLKDESAQLRAVMFRGSQRGLSFSPVNGMIVRAHGAVTVYEKRGEYQILVNKLEQGGQGSLQEQFEALKRKLQEEGLFEQSRKRPLPVLPQHVGVVTSSSGAAIRDILNVISRRFPNIHLLLAPSLVQGAGAAESIAAAIERLNAIGGLDVLIVGRGGGSLEDLWCFNEEVVARAIARSRIPVISAVGHEIDFTISDFVADLRAPTPSAAAELVVGCKDEFLSALRDRQERLKRVMHFTLERHRQRLGRLAGSYVFREPANLVSRHRQRMDTWDRQLRHALTASLQSGQQRVDRALMGMEQAGRRVVESEQRKLDRYRSALPHRLEQTVREAQRQLERLRDGLGYRGEQHLALHRQELKRLNAQLLALSPLSVLKRGYSVTRLADGTVVNRAGQIRDGVQLVTQLSEGKVTSVVESVEPKG